MTNKILIWIFDNVYLGRFAPLALNLILKRKGKKVNQEGK